MSQHHDASDNMTSADSGTAGPIRARWAAIGAALAVAVGGGGLGLVNAADTDADDAASSFVPIAACRLIDTRVSPNRTGIHESFGPGDEKIVAAHGTNGDCSIPSTATALTLNITSVTASEASFITVWPGGQRPHAASLNPAPGQPPTPNAVTTPLSAAGDFALYNDRGVVDLVVDVNGYFVTSDIAQVSDRLTAVEAQLTARVAEVEGQLTNRITQVESQVDTRLTDAEASVSAFDRLDAEARLDSLEASTPFAVSAIGPRIKLDAEVTSVVELTVAAPVDGHVTLNSTITINEQTFGEGIACSIGTGAEIDDDYLHAAYGPGFPATHSVLSGTRLFDISGGETTTYHLNCIHPFSHTTTIRGPVLTAIFTPA